MEIKRFPSTAGAVFVLASLIAVFGCATAQDEMTETQMMPVQEQMQQMHEKMMAKMGDCMRMQMSKDKEMGGMQGKPMGPIDDEAKQQMRQRMMAHMQSCMGQMEKSGGMGSMMQKSQESPGESADG